MPNTDMLGFIPMGGASGGSRTNLTQVSKFICSQAASQHPSPDMCEIAFSLALSFPASEKPAGLLIKAPPYKPPFVTHAPPGRSSRFTRVIRGLKQS